MWCLGISKEAWLEGNSLVYPLLLALGLVGLGYVIALWRVEGQLGLFTSMGAGSWKFTESWASTLTGSGAVLGLILAAQVLPQDAAVKIPYVMFNLMFGMVIVFAALVYNVIRKPVKVTVTNGPTRTVIENPVEARVWKGADSPTVTENPEKVTVGGGQTVTGTENRGLVVFFLVASVMVLWAVCGQLITTCLLIGEIESLPASLYRIFEGVILLSGVVAIVYGVLSVPWTLYTQTVREDTGQDKGFILP